MGFGGLKTYFKGWKKGWKSLFRLRKKSNRPTKQYSDVTLKDILPHLKTTLFITGAFCVAWAWDLVIYSISHVLADANPLDNQLAFADQPGPKHLFVLLLQYLVVCGGTALCSNRLRRQSYFWTNAAVMALEFFPSPIFAGKLMAYLSQFHFQPIEQALINFAATWVAAFLAYAAPIYLSQSGDLVADHHSSNDSDRAFLTSLLHRTGLIVQDTLGFGLGIAWNVLLSQFGPENRSEMNLVHLFALAAYLLMVFMIAFKLAAMEKKDTTSTDPESAATPSVWDQHLSLLSFAMYVVCAFTLVGFMHHIVAEDWVGNLESFGVLLVLAAIMSAMVSVADLDGAVEERNERNQRKERRQAPTEEDGMIPSSLQYDSAKFGKYGGLMNFLLLVPCVWCCCPWVSILILLAGMTETLSVREYWFRLVAMVAGLASSIEGSGMMTSGTDYLARYFEICGEKHCYHPWYFVGLQILLAIAATLILIPLIGPLSDQPPPSEPDTPTLVTSSSKDSSTDYPGSIFITSTSSTDSSTLDDPEAFPPTERQWLLSFSKSRPPSSKAKNGRTGSNGSSTLDVSDATRAYTDKQWFPSFSKSRTSSTPKKNDPNGKYCRATLY